MEKFQSPSPDSSHPHSVSSHNIGRHGLDGSAKNSTRGILSLKKRGHGSRSWITIDQNGESETIKLDKATLMRNCSLPARDLRLLDPMFIYPSTILGREKAIVVSLEQIRCIITAEKMILMNSLDGTVIQYQRELCKRLQINKEQPDGLPFEFRALELALEFTCMSLDAQRVQKVRDEIEHLMDDDGDMAEMYLTEKKQRMDLYSSSDLLVQSISDGAKTVSKSAPVSPVGSLSANEAQRLQRAFSSVVSSSKLGSSMSSSTNEENIEQLEMLLEAYFVIIDNTLSKLLSLKEYIDDTEDLINIKLGNVQNQLIQFELLLTTATFVATIFAVVSGVFGMNFEASIFYYPSAFNWVLVVTGIACAFLYFAFILYFRHKKVFPS